jgi:hypothetical protein
MIDLEQDYYLDVKAILNFISYSDTHSKEIEIIDKYEKDENKNFNTAEKTIKEITTSGDSNMDNISYDLVRKNFIMYSIFKIKYKRSIKHFVYCIILIKIY